MLRARTVLVSLVLAVMFVLPAFAGDNDLAPPTTKSSAAAIPKTGSSPSTASGSHTRMYIFLGVMAIAAVTWGVILHRYHDKFPILKHPDLNGRWRRPF
jgi:hypothetical protein